ncbi:MAG: amidohydrolase [Bacteroidota bacterium]|nr:amidohydrolase [Bacteroidota bacterium]
MSINSLRIGLIQTDLVWEEPADNMRRMEELLSESGPTDLILLPEMWSTGFSLSPERVAEETTGLTLNWMIDQAQKYNSAIAGSVAVREDGKYYNRFYCVHADGRITKYDKRHLFSYGKEDQHYTPGNEHTLLEIKGWKIMPVICYDLRFPVWCRNTMDYDLMVIVANWPTARIHHWDALLKARAIENQCYIAAVYRIGVDGNGLEYPGHSGVVDMNGLSLLDLNDRSTMEIIELNKSALDQYREHFRFLQDRDSFRLFWE